MHTEFTLIVGLFDKDTKRQEIGTLSARNIIANLCAETFGGCTVRESFGSYKHESGEIVIEPSLEVVILTDNEKAVRDLAQELKKVLNQESVTFAKRIMVTEFI